MLIDVISFIHCRKMASYMETVLNRPKRGKWPFGKVWNHFKKITKNHLKSIQWSGFTVGCFWPKPLVWLWFSGGTYQNRPNCDILLLTYVDQEQLISKNDHLTKTTFFAQKMWKFKTKHLHCCKQFSFTRDEKSFTMDSAEYPVLFCDSVSTDHPSCPQLHPWRRCLQWTLCRQYLLQELFRHFSSDRLSSCSYPIC